jgi:hypothetical protein
VLLQGVSPEPLRHQVTEMPPITPVVIERDRVRALALQRRMSRSSHQKT